MFICFTDVQGLYVMNVLETAYYCLLVNYRVSVWRFLSSGMLQLSSGNIPHLFWRYISFKLNGGLAQKKWTLEHEVSVCLQKLMNYLPRNVVSHPTTLILNFPVWMPKNLKAYIIEWKVTVWIAEIKNIYKFLDSIITRMFHKHKSLISILWQCGNIVTNFRKGELQWRQARVRWNVRNPGGMRKRYEYFDWLPSYLWSCTLRLVRFAVFLIVTNKWSGGGGYMGMTAAPLATDLR
jgi:hypothetical protein